MVLCTNCSLVNYEILICLLLLSQSFKYYESRELSGWSSRWPSGARLRRVRGTPFYYYMPRSRPSVGYFSAKDEETDDIELRANGGFRVSKPKPWREDDGMARRANRAAEVPADPNNDKLEMKQSPGMLGRMTMMMPRARMFVDSDEEDVPEDEPFVRRRS